MAEDGERERLQSRRIFVNNVDIYQGKNIANYLSQCVIGASLEDLDEEEEETESIASEEAAAIAPKEGCYDIIGTLKEKSAPKPDFVKEIISYESKEQLFEHLVECDVIVYDITEDPDQIGEAVWAVSEIHSYLDKIEKPKMFILISTVMTWARSKPLDPDDSEMPFTEDDYRRRKPHPNFKEHISAEKTVIKLGKTNKSKLSTYVVASGLTYGCGENLFHYLFKGAWHNAPELQCFGQGDNIVPTIHIKDLAGVIQNIADSRPKVKYLVAVDESKNTLQEIVKAVSDHLGTGKIKKITKEDALLSKDIQQADFDQLLVNLRMDAVNLKENMRIRWQSEMGIVENVDKIIKEFKEERKLLPMRIVILGSPAAGKTTLAKQLCEHYKLHHIQIKDVIDEALENLAVSAARLGKEGEEEEEGDEEDEAQAQEDAELLQTINEAKENNSDRIEDTHIITFFKNKLHSMPCQNQGYVLDGYPKTKDQAKELFLANNEDEGVDGKLSFDKKIMPEVVYYLEAGDEFLKNRIMNLPENVVQGTHNNEEGLNRRLAKYKLLNTEDETVRNFFDEAELEPNKIDVGLDKSSNLLDTMAQIKKNMGMARNYGPTPEELEEMKRVEEENKLKKDTEERLEKEKQEAEEAAERKRRQEEWTARLEDVKKEEYESLEAQSVPLRNYLMKHVMPTLTQGLMDCCKARPDDAVDFLAEYLFQHNPQID